MALKASAAENSSATNARQRGPLRNLPFQRHFVAAFSTKAPRIEVKK
jgi:hypothetical protein